MAAVGFSGQTGAGAFIAVTPGTTLFTVAAATTIALDKLLITNTDTTTAQAYSLFHIPSGGVFSGDDYVLVKNRGIDPSDGTVGHAGTEDVREVAGVNFQTGDKLVIFAANANKLKAEWSGTQVSPLSPLRLTFSGNEITDLTRALGVQGDGRSGDSSYGIWAAATNLITNGGFETNTAGWTFSANPITRITTDSKFGSASLSQVPTVQYAAIISPPVAVTALATFSVSLWINRLTTNDNISLIFVNGSDVSIINSSTIPAIIGWQRVTISGAPKLGETQAKIIIQNNSVAPADTYHIDGVQIEAGPIATPYIHTDGAVATRAAGRVQVPSSILNATQGWVAARVRTGKPSTLSQTGRIFSWSDGTINNRVEVDIFANDANVQRVSGGVGVGLDTTQAAFAVGDVLTVIGAWTPTQLKMSFNGGVFATGANASIPVGLGATFDIGDQQPGQINYLNGDVIWFACGTGTLTDANAAAINAFGNTDPGLLAFPGIPTCFWSANSVTADVLS